MNNKKTLSTTLSCLMRGSAILVAAGAISTTAAATPSIMGEGADISTMCGSKPMTVGLADGFGGNTWRRIALYELEQELSRCPNVKQILYTNANGDQQKANADINSLVAQGVDVLLVYPDFGAAELPAMRKALKQGVTVIPYNAKLDGVPGKDYTANIWLDTFEIAKAWADWYGSTLKSGNLVFMGGTPGAASSQNFLDGFKEGLKKYPDLKLLEENFIVTSWNPVDAQKATTGLIAKYPEIDGIATDYGVTAYAVVKAYEQAGLPVPALATVASNNELNCGYIDRKSEDKAFPYYTVDGTTTGIRFAVRRGVAAFQGTPNPESDSYMPFLYADSSTNTDPKCDREAPLDADLSSILPPEKLQEIFKNKL